MLIAMLALHFIFHFQQIAINRSGLMNTIPPHICQLSQEKYFLIPNMMLEVKSQKYLDM